MIIILNNNNNNNNNQVYEKLMHPHVPVRYYQTIIVLLNEIKNSNILVMIMIIILNNNNQVYEKLLHPHVPVCDYQATNVYHVPSYQIHVHI